MAEKKLSPFNRALVDMVADKAGCGAQYNGSPCNTCFHTIMEEEMGEDIAHLFWTVVLGVRGDYKEKDLMQGLKENL